jgi:arylsulfatase A-like enzyme
LNLFDAHGPYIPPPGWTRAFHPAPLPKGAERLSANGATKMVTALQEARKAGDPAKVARYKAEVDAARQRLGNLHDDCLQAMDASLGGFLRDIESGSDRSTLVVIVGDHGEQFGEHGLFSHGNSLYETLLRVPLIFAVLGPSNGPIPLPEGRRIGGPVSIREVGATVLDLVDGPKPDGSRTLPGASLARAWTSPEGATEGFVVFTDFRSPRAWADPWLRSFEGYRMFGLAKGRHVYLDQGDGKVEFYDVIDDPDQLRDLAASPDVETAARLQEFKRLAETIDPTLSLPRLGLWSRSNRPVIDGEPTLEDGDGH